MTVVCGTFGPPSRIKRSDVVQGGISVFVAGRFGEPARMVAFLCHAQGCSLSTPGKVIIGVIHFLTGLIAANLGIENSLCSFALLAWFFFSPVFGPLFFFFCSRRTIDFGGESARYRLINIKSGFPART